MLRFSIWQLLLAISVIAIALAALLNASPLVSAAMTAAVSVALACAVLLAIYRQGEQRAFWIGFALLGWLYILFCHGDFFSGNTNPYGWSRLITSRLATALYDAMYLQHLSRLGGGPPVAVGPDRVDFLNIAHALSAFVLAVAGGCFARWAHFGSTQVRAR